MTGAPLPGRHTRQAPASVAAARQDRGRRLVVACVALLTAACLLSSCKLIDKMRPEKEHPDKRAAQLQDLQLRVMRFADEYAGRILEPIRTFQGHATPVQRLDSQNWLVQQTTTAYTIASGPNAINNALDMVVLATMSDMVMDDAAATEQFGDQTPTLRAAYGALEGESWELLHDFVTPEQVAAVHQALDNWRAANPHVHSVSYVHFRDFVSSPEAIKSDRGLGGSGVLSLLGLDPLSTLDPTVQEFARTRQSVERAMYFMQRAPQLMDLQVTRVTYQFAVMPESQALLVDLDRTSIAAESAGKLAAKLPQVVAQEREAAIRQVMDSIQSQQAQMRELLVDMRATLQAGTAASDSVHQTTRALDTFIAGFRTPPEPGKPPGKPFDITQYTATAHELALASTQLQALLAQLNSAGPGVSRLTDTAATQLNGVVDRAYRRIVELILILVAATLVGAVLYRLTVRRLSAPPRG